MELEEMGREYLRQACSMREKAQRLRLEAQRAQGGEVKRLLRKAEILENIARELKITGENLVNYYENR